MDGYVSNERKTARCAANCFQTTPSIRKTRLAYPTITVMLQWRVSWWCKSVFKKLRNHWIDFYSITLQSFYLFLPLQDHMCLLCDRYDDIQENLWKTSLQCGPVLWLFGMWKLLPGRNWGQFSNCRHNVEFVISNN